jgi:enamine deaminase RidA (YjgF/YER057c/UK114 family)
VVQAPGAGLSAVATPSKRLEELGISLPSVPAPAGAYVPARRSGSLVFTAGQVPIVDGKPAALGKVGAEIDVDEAYGLAGICALNALAAVDALVGIDAVAGIVKVVGFVASAPGFTGQPKVINGASDLLGRVFGDAGQHARSAVGVAELPLGVPVEVELVVELGSS